MKMKIKKGNLLDAFDDGIQAFCHQANCFSTFGKGVALAIKEKFPLAYMADVNFRGQPLERLGKFSLCEMPEGRIYNIYSQFDYRFESLNHERKIERKTDYEALYKGLEMVRDDMISKNLKSLALPYFYGCGLGGGNWDIVKTMFEVVFGDAGIQVTAYKLE